jgi:hypothetical protein
MMTNQRMPDFKYIYANGFGVQFGGVEFMLSFGIKESVVSDDITEQVGVILTPSSVKLLSVLLTKFVSAIEAESGEIPLDASKVAKVDEALGAAAAESRKRKAAAEQPTGKA